MSDVLPRPVFGNVNFQPTPEATTVFQRGDFVRTRNNPRHGVVVRVEKNGEEQLVFVQWIGDREVSRVGLLAVSLEPASIPDQRLVADLTRKAQIAEAEQANTIEVYSRESKRLTKVVDRLSRKLAKRRVTRDEKWRALNQAGGDVVRAKQIIKYIKGESNG